MLRIHCVQLCYNLSDPAMEDLLYEAESVRRFCGCHSRRGLANAHLARRGLSRTIVDATTVHQTKKGNEWHFGMKLHIGVRRRRQAHAARHRAGRPWRVAMRPGLRPLRRFGYDKVATAVWRSGPARASPAPVGRANEAPEDLPPEQIARQPTCSEDS